jgi:arabinan endo-1,5-alpha-L-arabinosidase
VIPRATALAVLSLCAVALAVPASAPAAGIGGTTRITDGQEQRSCDYATTHGSATKRQGYARACQEVTASDSASKLRVAASSKRRTTYQNPVYNFSFPDPGVLRNTSSDYYAYGTGSLFPVLHSTDLVRWESVGTALASRPSWVVPTGDSHPWAPSVLRSAGSCPGTTSPGCYYLYYVGLSGQHTPSTHCVGVAISQTPAGPFSDQGPVKGPLDATGRPPGCGDDAGYSNIDPAPFVDPADGRAYLYLSTNRRCDAPTPNPCPILPTVSVLPLNPDLVSAAGPRSPLFAGTAGTWEQGGQEPKVENPWVQKRGSTYYLFYSGGDYTGAYGMGYATSSSPTDSFAKAPSNPILRQTADVLSPGGGSGTTGPAGGDWMVYHGRAGSYTAPRTLRIDPIVWQRNGSVQIKGPTTGVQSPAP